MPVYVTAKTKSGKQIFSKCNDSAVAGRWQNKVDFLDEDYSLVTNHSYSVLRRISGDICPFNFVFSLTTPAYEPIKASTLNVMNEKDDIETLSIVTIEKSPTGGKPKIVEQYTAKDGALQMVRLLQDSEAEKNTKGEMHMTFYFDSLIYDNNRTNTSGQLSTSLG